jgi:putative ABC transport system permease protein
MLKNYLKTALRNFQRNKSTTIINIAGLALGISVSILIFQYVTFETSYDSFNINADRIFRIRSDRIYFNKHDKSAGCPPALAPTLKNEFPEVQESARLRGTDVTYINVENNFAENIDKAYYTEPSFFKIFTLPILQGSSLKALDNPYNVIISESFLQKYFGNANPINKEISLTNEYGNHNYKITGVFKDAPPNSHVKFNLLISYKTLVTQNKQAEYYWGWNAFNTYILLKPNANPKSLEAKLPALVEKYKDYGPGYKRVYLLQPLKDIHLYSNLRFEPEVNGSAETVKFLSIIALFVLILAWVNNINLSTSRSLTRAKEVGVRKVLGSSRIQLLKQFLTESFLLNIAALILAIVIIAIVLPFFNDLTGKPLTIGLLQSNWALLMVTFTAGIILSGIYPAFVMSSFNPLNVLKKKSDQKLKVINLRKGLVIFQFAVSIILIASTLVVYEQLLYMRNKDLGINIDQTLILNAPAGKDDTYQSVTNFKYCLLDVPGVKNVSASASIPGKGYSNASSGVRKYGSNPKDGTQGFFIDVDENYFKLYNVLLAAGRCFTMESRFNNEIILNEEAVKVYGFKNAEDAVNKKLIFDGFDGQSISIVGVIKDYHQESPKSPLLPVIFNPINASDLNLTKYFSLKIDTRNIQQTLSQIKSKWDKIFPNQPFEYNFLVEVFNSQYKADQQFGKVFGLFTFLAIIISCLGLLGLASFTNLQRTKEIGIRKVLGASVPGIVSMLSVDFTKWVLLANIIAWPVAYYFMNKWLEDFAYRIEISWWMFVLSGGIVLVIALATVSVQAIKAATANPVESLKYE